MIATAASLFAMRKIWSRTARIDGELPINRNSGKAITGAARNMEARNDEDAAERTASGFAMHVMRVKCNRSCVCWEWR
jgi:hypothetical protein